MDSLVSVIVPVYNSEIYLEACLNSILNQTYKKIEVIIINDGSSDDSESIIKKYAEADTRIKYFTQTNNGLGYTRNKGIRLSSGEFIFFLDSDDIVPNTAINDLVTAIEKNKSDIAVGKVIRINNHRMYIPIRHLEFDLYREGTLTNLMKSPELLQDSIACNKLWRKDFLFKHQLLFTEGRYYEDLNLTLKGAILAEDISVTNKVVYYWRVRDLGDPSITQEQMKLENTVDRIQALAANRKWLLDNKIENRIVREHDLKCLLDILRLHVIKFSQVKEEEKQKWLREIEDFIKKVPSDISRKLPDKEYKIYRLLMEKKYNDLYLFSQLFMGTETKQIVVQDKDKFLLKGTSQVYDVTNYLKPTMVVSKIEKEKTNWLLIGNLSIPKASKKIIGELYAVNRKSKENIIICEIMAQPIVETSCYPYEEQNFGININNSLLKWLKSGSTYDFYYRLKEFPNYLPSRVRLLEDGCSLIERKTNYKMYRTNYGNLSLEVSNESLLKSLRIKGMKLKRFIKDHFGSNFSKKDLR